MDWRAIYLLPAILLCVIGNSISSALQRRFCEQKGQHWIWTSRVDKRLNKIGISCHLCKRRWLWNGRVFTANGREG